VLKFFDYYPTQVIFSATAHHEVIRLSYPYTTHSTFYTMNNPAASLGELHSERFNMIDANIT